MSKNLAPSADQRGEIKRRLGELSALASERDIDVSMAHVADLVLAVSSGRLDKAQADAKARGFINAVHDLPPVAVAEACMRWDRAETGRLGYGEEKHEPDFGYPPNPPQLRQVAKPIADNLVAQVALLASLLKAKVIDDTKPEISATLKERTAERVEKIVTAAPPGPRYKDLGVMKADLDARRKRKDETGAAV